MNVHGTYNHHRNLLFKLSRVTSSWDLLGPGALRYPEGRFTNPPTRLNWSIRFSVIFFFFSYSASSNVNRNHITILQHGDRSSNLLRLSGLAHICCAPLFSTSIIGVWAGIEHPATKQSRKEFSSLCYSESTGVGQSVKSSLLNITQIE